MYITPVIFKKRSFLTVVHSMKGEELAPVEHIVQTLQEKTCRLVDLAPKIWKVMRSEDDEISQRWRLLMVCNFFVGSWDWSDTSIYSVIYCYIVRRGRLRQCPGITKVLTHLRLAIPWIRHQIVVILIKVIARSKCWIMPLSILWGNLSGWQGMMGILVTCNPGWACNNLTKRASTCETPSVDLFPGHPTSQRHHRSWLAEKLSNGSSIQMEKVKQ